MSSRELYVRLADGSFALADRNVERPIATINEDAMSCDMHTSMSVSMSHQSSVEDKAAAYKTMRKKYDELIKQEPAQWKKVFTKVANLFAEEKRRESGRKKRVVAAASGAAAAADVVVDGNEQTISICASTNNKIVTFDRKVNPVIFIGRHAACDVRVNVNLTSRVHLIVLCAPGSEIILVDVGSYMGWTIESRSRPGLPLKGHQSNECHGTRIAAIECDVDEAVTIRWRKTPKSGRPSIATHNYIQINPPVCIACIDAPRSVLYACGHLVLCKACNDRQNQPNRVCELCRSPVVANQIVNDDHGCMSHA